MPWNAENYWMTRDPKVKRGMVMIGAAMRRQRTKRGLSQRDVERMTGIHQSTISRLETGSRCGLRWSQFAAIVAVLGGLDFDEPGTVRLFGAYGVSPNPVVGRQQLEEAEARLQEARAYVDRRATELAEVSAS